MKYLVRCWQAFATRIGYRTGWRHSAQGLCPNMPEQWSKIPWRIYEVAKRLKHVQIENMDASKKDIFLGLGPAEYLGWMEVKPYTGKIMFRGGERCG